MVLRKFREQRYVKRNIKIPLSDLGRWNLVGKDAIAVTPAPTGNSWQGVLSAAKGLFGERLFLLPQYYSNCIYSEKELHQIAKILVRQESEQIVFNGYLPYFKILMEDIIKAGKKVSLIDHESHTSFLEGPDVASHFDEVLQLHKKGYIYHLGFVKKDMDKTIGLLTGHKAYPIILKTDESIIGRTYSKYEGLNIGVMTHDSFRKNLYNMVSAALLHEEAKVHLKDKYKTFYLQNQDRIIVHGYFKSQEDFYRVIGGVDVNFYVTYSECWGQFVNESLALGVPCLCSDVSAVLDFDEDLKKMLVVNEFDNDFAIYNKSKEVLANKDYFITKGPDYVKKVNVIASDYMKAFLE